MHKARPLEARKAKFKAQLDAIEQVEALIATLRETLDAFPELRQDFVDELRLLADPPQEDAALAGEKSESAQGEEALGTEADDEYPGETGATNTVERMTAFFRRRGNTPATAAEIIEELGVTANTVRSILYKTNRNKGRFRRVHRPGQTLSFQLADPSRNGSHG